MPQIQEIEEVKEDTQNISLDSLIIPTDYANYENITEDNVIARLEQWRQKAVTNLFKLSSQLKKRQIQEMPLNEKVDVICAVAPLDSEGPWADEQTKDLAHDILEPFSTVDVPLIEQILSTRIKSAFKVNPHPALNPETGRKLPRKAGGPLGQLDHLEGQLWKTYPGIDNTVLWCARNMRTDVYEKLWHLIIPPVMILLDDYEAKYKLRGILIVSEMLNTVPPELLLRTGINQLLFTSLKTCMTFVHNPLSANIMRAVIPVQITLTNLTTPPKSAQRFDKLCQLLGDGIIGSIWLYGSRDLGTIEASLDVLPDVMKALGIGSVRYLKGIIPQLVYPLIPALDNTSPTSLQLKSLEALIVVIEECAPRIYKWKGTILDGVARCWVTLIDNGGETDDEIQKIRQGLRKVVKHLGIACPAILQDEIPLLLEVDSVMFKPLLQVDDLADGTRM
ncbi:TTI2 family protein [Abortiporus biennis]